MRILGVHGGFRFAEECDPSGFYFHDAAAVLVRDGELIAAIEEERLNRLKHANCFPVESIRYCLRRAGIELSAVDRIAITGTEGGADQFAKARYAEDPTHRIKPRGREYVASLFEAAFRIDVSDRIRFCHHHMAHAWSAFAPSGFDSSLVFITDGDGDNCSGMVLTAGKTGLKILRTYPVSDSLGHLYQRTIQLLGYGRFDEYKVMGLAPYGDPNRFARMFERCYQLLPDGNYRLADGATWFGHFDAAGLLDGARRKGEPFTDNHRDVAAALQLTLERIVMHVLSYYREATGERSLCIAGGVAHNCSMNGRILASGVFDRVFVQPAAHDAGCALGAAWATAAGEDSHYRRPALPHLYLGTSTSASEELAEELAVWDAFIKIEKAERIAAEVAELLAGGAVVGWVQGRSEFGPRALGNRSILADPRPAENREIINRMVKKREAYRPFAPSVLEEFVTEYFEAPPQQTSFPFMIFILEVKKHVRSVLGAITHVDGTARVHTVSRSTNELYWELIDEFRKRTNIPMVLNTSFNNHAEPIVDSVADAVTCFLTTEIPVLAIGDYIVTKRSAAQIRTALSGLAPDLPAWRRLVKGKMRLQDGRYATAYSIESTRSQYFGPQLHRISREMYLALNQCDGARTFGELTREYGSAVSASDAILSELQELWGNRLISLRPKAAHTVRADCDRPGAVEQQDFAQAALF
jgi:carbamoyltransferase